VLFAFATLMILVVMSTITQISDDDIYWHLATGRWIWEHGAVPDQDVFGFITQGQPWIPFEWGWDLLTYQLYAISGSLFPIQLLPPLIALSIALMMLSLMRRLELSPPIIVITLLLTFLISLNRLVPRPQIVTMLGLAIVTHQYFTFRYSTRSTIRRLYVLPAVFLLWANMHPGVLSGILLLVVLTSAEIIQYGYSRRWPERKSNTIAPLPRRDLLTLVLILASCCVMVIVTPHGFRSLSYVYAHTQLNFLGNIEEWVPPFSSQFNSAILWCYKVTIILGCGTLLYSYLKRNALPGTMYLAFALYSLRAVRFIADFAVVTALGTAQFLEFVLGRAGARGRHIAEGGVLTLGLILLMLSAIATIPTNVFYASINYNMLFGFGVNRAYLPVQLVDFMTAHEVQGRPFNQFEIGGLLIWAVPGGKNFIDSRNLNEGIVREYFQILQARPGFEEKLEQIGIDHVALLLPYFDQPEEGARPSLLKYCATHPNDWKLVYWDDFSVLYVRNEQKFSGLIDKYAYSVLDPYLYAFHTERFDSLRAAMPEIFSQELDRKLSEDPNNVIANVMAEDAR